MKNSKFGLAPTVIGFGRSTLEKRIIAILNYKKPTALSTVLSALLVVGIGSTAMFTITPKTEAVTVPEPDPAVTASEPVLDNEPTSDTVLDNDPTGNDPETGEPEPIDPEAELESKYPRGEHSIPIFPEDKNGVYYSESGDVVRVPIHVLEYNNKLPTCGIGRIDVVDNGTYYAHVIIYKECPEGFNYEIYWGDEFVVLTRNKSISDEQSDIYYQMRKDGIIPCSRECFHNLNVLD